MEYFFHVIKDNIMNKHLYSLTLEHLAVEDVEDSLHEPISFTFHSHESAAEVMKKMNIFAQDSFQETNQVFALGLLLLTSVVLRNKEHPLFEELLPALIMTKKKVRKFVNGTKVPGNPAVANHTGGVS